MDKWRNAGYLSVEQLVPLLDLLDSKAGIVERKQRKTGNHRNLFCIICHQVLIKNVGKPYGCIKPRPGSKDKIFSCG